MSECDLDPAYEWVENARLGQSEPSFFRGRKKPCEHTRGFRTPVESLDGTEILAQLCLACDTQLHAGFVSRFDPPTTAELSVEAVSFFSQGGWVR